MARDAGTGGWVLERKPGSTNEFRRHRRGGCRFARDRSCEQIRQREHGGKTWHSARTLATRRPLPCLDARRAAWQAEGQVPGRQLSHGRAFGPGWWLARLPANPEPQTDRSHRVSPRAPSSYADTDLRCVLGTIYSGTSHRGLAGSRLTAVFRPVWQARYASLPDAAPSETSALSLRNLARAAIVRSA